MMQRKLYGRIKSRQRVNSSLIVAVGLLLAVVSYTGFSTPAQAGADSSFTQTSGRPFASTSVWNSTIPTSPVIDSNSSAIITQLSGGSNQQVANMYAFGIPVYNADASTPKVTVTCTEDWGTCPIAGSIPVPTNARPSSGSDGPMVILDWSTHTSYEFWQAKKTSSTTWSTSWGAKVTDFVNGTGLGGGSSTASDMSRLGGVIREYEISSGTISHALTFSSSLSCSTTYRYPADKTDGTNTASGCIPEGTRVQLDPSINVDAIAGITAGEKAVAKALQTYGAYDVDTGGTRMGISFELDPNATSSSQIPSVYSQAGLSWDYFQMSHIPWSKLRVLSSWNGSDVQAPTAPTSLKSTTTAAKSEKISWTAATDNVAVSGYTIWRGDASYANWTQVGTVTGTTLTYTDSTLSPSTSYSYAVRATDAAGNVSASSNSILITTPAK